MNINGLLVLFYKEVMRFYKVILQTLVAPVVTTLLYLLIFSHVLEDHIKIYGQVNYADFLIPGLIMMAMIQNAFANSSSSLIQSKVTGNIIFVLLSPLSPAEFYLGFLLASIVRGLLVGLSILIVASFFTTAPVHHYGVIISFSLLSGAVLGTLGIIAGIWAEKFDHIAGFQNFIVVPLSFLSGVFYSIHSLPPVWQTISQFNPFLYMVDGFRYGFLGVSDINPMLSGLYVASSLIALAAYTLYLIKAGYRLRD